MSRTDSRAARSGRLATYAVAAAGPMIAGSAAMADAVIVDITTVNANDYSNFTIDLAAAGLGGAYTFYNIGIGGGFYVFALATNQLDNQQFVGTSLRSGSEIIANSNTIWNAGTYAFANPATDTTKYLGFRLTVGEGDSRFGWVEYVNSGGSVTVSRWAYESNLNTAIATPGASTPAVPGLGGLAALACGAAGVRRNRNRVA